MLCIFKANNFYYLRNNFYLPCASLQKNILIYEMTEYDLESGNNYTVDKWCKKMEDFIIDNYNPATKYDLIKISIKDVKYYLKNKKFAEEVENQINSLLKINKFFFRVSQRSPKDAYKKEYKAKNKDSPEKKLELEKLRKSKLLVENIQDIYNLIRKSKRVMEDFKLLVKQNKITELYLVFQEWRESSGVEYRCFIKNKKLIGICIYKPEFYPTDTIIPVELIQNFTNKLINYINYDKMILDIFIDKDIFINKDKVYFIEINPFEEYVDPFKFSWKLLNNINSLIVI